MKHLVVIFQENVSFDHYFATYPKAMNPPGEPAFTALPNTPGLPGQGAVNTLASAGLLTNNPNKTNTKNGADAADPFRLDITQAATASQHHNYMPEQAAYDNFAMDLFPRFAGNAGKGGAGAFATKGLVMGYYDGNTVTALWNYAQHFAMSDNSFGTTFGPSTPGALNLASGQTNGAILPPDAQLDADGTYAKSAIVPDGAGGWTTIGDLDPTGDLCSKGKTAAMSGKNIGDLLNAADIAWGFFEGGFDLSATNADGSTGCARATASDVTKVKYADYVPASPAVPVLRFDRQSAAQAPEFRRCDRNERRRRRQPSIRHRGFYRSAEKRRTSGGQLPQGAGLSGRPCRLFRSARRTDLRRRDDQRAGTISGMAEHRGRHSLGRFGRLVRSCLHNRQSVGGQRL